MSALSWAWTNEAKTEARADRWTASVAHIGKDRWAVRHDDFPGFGTLTGYENEEDQNWHRFVDAEIVPSFLAWLASQPVTLEHREGEYVHFKCDANTHYQFVDGAWRNPDYPRVPVTVRDIEDWNARLGVTAHGFLAPGTITKATPAEPTGFGYVGSVTDARGDVWDVTRDVGPVTNRVYYAWTRTRDGAPGNRWKSWSDVLALGTFEAVERG